MENIYEEIEKIFTEKPIEENFAQEILNELKEIKSLLKNKQQPVNIAQPNKKRGMYQFVKDLRISLKADTINNIYPEIDYHGTMLGVNFKGLLYEKKDLRVLSKYEALKAYEYFFHAQKAS